jgi:hypothetical protein
MKKPLLIILSIIIYFIVLWLLAVVSIGINIAVFGRATGGITAFGGIASIWLAYKFVRWLWGKYSN